MSTSPKSYQKIIIIALAIIIPLVITFVVLSVISSPKVYQAYVKKVAFFKAPQLCALYPFGVTYGDYVSKAKEVRYFCHAEYAIQTQNIEYCQSLDSEVAYLDTASQKTYCLRILAKNMKKPELCDDIVLYGWEKEYEADLISTCKEEAK